MTPDGLRRIIRIAEYEDYFTHRFEDRSRLLRVLSAVVILVFFTIYCASGMVAGARLFERTFGFSYPVALWGCAAATVNRTFSRASWRRNR